MGLYLGNGQKLKIVFSEGTFCLNIPSSLYDTASVLGKARLGYMILSYGKPSDTASVLGKARLGYMILSYGKPSDTASVLGKARLGYMILI